MTTSTPSRPRILLVIQASHFIRHYILTGAHRVLEDFGDLVVAFPSDLPSRELLDDADVVAEEFSYDPQLRWRHQFVFNVLMWRHRQRSSSFYFRAARHLSLPLLDEMGWSTRTVRDVARFLWELVRHPRLFLVFLLGHPGLAEAFVAVYTRVRLPVNTSLAGVVDRTDPDLIVVPSSSYDAVGNDVCRIAARQGRRTLFLVDNWDNLSSKSVLWIKPDLMGVWGPQSVEHALDIQGMPRRSVVPIGTPRFEPYFRARADELPSPFPFGYALFVGCAVPFDEVSALDAIEAEISSRPELYEGLKVVYRPHPWRQPRTSERDFDPSRYRHVVADLQIGADFEHRDGALPSLEYYAPLLQNARFVVGAPTTMVIEAMLFRKWALVLGYDDGSHVESPHRQLRYYHHFQGLDSVPGTQFCREYTDLGRAFQRVFECSGERPFIDSDAALSYFLAMSPGSYDDRLRRLVENALSAPSA